MGEFFFNFGAQARHLWGRRKWPSTPPIALCSCWRKSKNINTDKDGKDTGLKVLPEPIINCVRYVCNCNYY